MVSSVALLVSVLVSVPNVSTMRRPWLTAAALPTGSAAIEGAASTPANVPADAVSAGDAVMPSRLTSARPASSTSVSTADGVVPSGTSSVTR